MEGLSFLLSLQFDTLSGTLSILLLEGRLHYDKTITAQILREIQAQ